MRKSGRKQKKSEGQHVNSSRPHPSHCATLTTHLPVYVFFPQDRARAERMKAALGGPTASTGRLTARHMTMAQRRAEEEAERRAVEAAMQQGQTAYT